MDPKLTEILGRTNLGELVRPAAPELDLNQPVEAVPPPKSDPSRSTTDPFQIYFATADIAGKLQDSRSGKGVKTFALIFLGGPMMIFGVGLIFMAWSNPETSAVRAYFATLVGLAFAGFWPYVMFARRRNRLRNG